MVDGKRLGGQFLVFKNRPKNRSGTFRLPRTQLKQLFGYSEGRRTKVRSRISDNVPASSVAPRSFREVAVPKQPNGSQFLKGIKAITASTRELLGPTGLASKHPALRPLE